MWIKFQAVMLVFFCIVIGVETWRIITGLFFVKPHALIDGTIAAYFAIHILRDYGKTVVPGFLATASTVVAAFTLWAAIR
jgi:hypothetical protein